MERSIFALEWWSQAFHSSSPWCAFGGVWPPNLAHAAHPPLSVTRVDGTILPSGSGSFYRSVGLRFFFWGVAHLPGSGSHSLGNFQHSNSYR